ncbi:MAG TPA: tellurite resistance TerB family protein [Rhodospirillales bacterium]|jgi:tellurite resistance protein|nr:tellurite resistance TerB family protein [Rhodospirillales bacterium]HJO68079.1 tellurite resistance TerB family protein [Rhodospirillales bacterium]
MTAINHHTALIYVMVIVSAADGEMTDAELHVIGELTRLLPVFADYEKDLLPATAEACAVLLDDEDGLENALTMIKEALPARLKETAYAVACDVAAADGDVHQEELRLLEMIRHQVGIDRLTAAAIERAARARFATA